MIEFLKTKFIWFLLVLLALSVAGNTYFIMGKGINIDKKTIITATTTSYANSSSSAISINVVDTQFYSKNRVLYQLKQFNSIDEALIFINGQTEGTLYNKEIVVLPPNIYVLYRAADDSNRVKTGETTQKTVNGVEVKP